MVSEQAGKSNILAELERIGINADKDDPGVARLLELVKERAKIAASDKITLVSYPPRKTIFDLVWNHQNDSELESQVRAIVGKMPIRAMVHGGVMRLMPFTIDVK